MKVGSTWNNEIKNGNGIEMNNTYTVSKIDKEFVYLDLNGVISGVANGKLNGDLKIDRTSGLTRYAHSISRMSAMGNEIKLESTIINKKQ